MPTARESGGQGCVAGTLAAIPSNIDPAHKFSWGENLGWMNWLDANATNDGVVVGNDFLSGSIWAENAGWINVGAGAGPYANTDDTDYGVNILGDTDLDGFAWSENLGWVNFGWGAAGDLPGRAQFDGSRFRGYAWGENAGWINLDDSDAFVAMADCSTGDADGDGDIDLADLLTLQECFSGPAGGPLGPVCARCYDFDGDGDADLADFIVFQTRFTGSQ
ncbi:MAG: hypothetical protein IH897_15685 [Planctomycetes bacterium]|nr:hypothetical protein [Planctomycetota bacterium]